jgi:hypothetical protein
MADTLTTKGLTILDPLLNYDVNKFNVNTQKINDLLGTIICTSTTRPSTNLYDGMMLYETDTQRFVVRASAAWVAVPNLVIVASHTVRNAIVTKYDGQMVYRQDRDWLEIWDGAAWRVVGTAHCTSVADRDGASGITSPYNGQVVITTDTYTKWVRKAGVWTPQPRGLIARARRTTSSSVSTGALVPVLRLDNVFARGGNALRVCTGTLHTTSSVAGDNVRVDILYNTSGVATTASATLPGARAFELFGSATFGNTSFLNTTYTPASDETLSLLLVVARAAGSGNTLLFADGNRCTEMFVYDEGVDPGDTGVDL